MPQSEHSPEYVADYKRPLSNSASPEKRKSLDDTIAAELEILRAGLLSETNMTSSPESPTKETAHVSLLRKLKICDLDSQEEVKSFAAEEDNESAANEGDTIPKVKITSAPPLIEEQHSNMYQKMNTIDKLYKYSL